MSNMDIVDLSVVKHLQMGKERIKQGWCQNKLRKRNIDGVPDRWCAIGALLTDHCVVRTIPPFERKTIDQLLSALGYKDYSYTFPVARWNNAPERKVEDVLALYDKAICLATVEAYKGVLVDA